MKKIKMGARTIYDPGKNNIFTDCIILLLISMIFMRYLSLLPTNVCNIMILVGGTLSIVYVGLHYRFDNVRNYLLFLILYTIFGVANFLITGNNGLTNLLWVFGYMGIAVLLLETKCSHLLLSMLYFAWCIFFFLFFIIGSISSSFILANSRNHVSIYTLLLFSLLCISAERNGKTISLVQVLMFVLSCMSAGGRSGIAVAAVMVLFYLFFDMLGATVRKGNPLKKTFLFIIILGLIIIGERFFSSFISNSFYKFAAQGVSSQRYMIWKSYIDKVFSNPEYILTGAPIQGSYYLDRYSENLHNSFLMLHATHGLPLFIYVISKVIKKASGYMKEKRYMLLMIISLIIIRMNFDYTNFDGCLDLPLMYLLFERKSRETRIYDRGIR